ncbi:MAG: tetratricopeptide repeat protein [Candidatus Thorarchaeota archaeon]
MSVSKEDYTEYDWFGEARVRETAGNLEGALEAFEESLKLNPKFAKAWYYKAELHYHMKQIKEAQECARKAIELKPSWKKHFEKNMPELKF